MKIRDILLLLPGWFWFLWGWLNPFPTLKSATQFFKKSLFLFYSFYLIFFHLFLYFIFNGRISVTNYLHRIQIQVHSDVAKNSVWPLTHILINLRCGAAITGTELEMMIFLEKLHWVTRLQRTVNHHRLTCSGSDDVILIPWVVN